MSLIFNILPVLVITFLPGSKRLLISWLQSPSAVILQPGKIKSATVSTVSLSICHEVMGPDAMILVFWMLSFKPTFSLSSFTFIRRLFNTYNQLKYMPISLQLTPVDIFQIFPIRRQTCYFTLKGFPHHEWSLYCQGHCGNMSIRLVLEDQEPAIDKVSVWLSIMAKNWEKASSLSAFTFEPASQLAALPITRILKSPGIPPLWCQVS